MSKRAIANLIIRDPEDGYLLQMRDSAAPTYPLSWAFFGGGIDKGETPMDTAVREFKEELGVHSSPKDFRQIIQVEDDERIRHLAFYIPRLTWADIEIHEGAGGAFFTRDDLLKLDLDPGTRNVAENFLQ